MRCLRRCYPLCTTNARRSGVPPSSPSREWAGRRSRISQKRFMTATSRSGKRLPACLPGSGGRRTIFRRRSIFTTSWKIGRNLQNSREQPFLSSSRPSPAETPGSGASRHGRWGRFMTPGLFCPSSGRCGTRRRRSASVLSKHWERWAIAGQSLCWSKPSIILLTGFGWRRHGHSTGWAGFHRATCNVQST